VADQQKFIDDLQQQFGEKLLHVEHLDMVTVELSRDHLINVCQGLWEKPFFKFEMLIDLCGVDYLHYGLSEWRTHTTTASGFSRGTDTDKMHRVKPWDKPRFAVVYHLLSLTNNLRVRLKVFVSENDMMVPSVMPIWDAANWFEREAFDLFGFEFDGHPDLRRLLTDYGFKGHPFRKDFPLVGEVELRYDEASERCIYEPVSINPRVLVPKVIRDDSRYHHLEKEEGNPNA
jgi:NADH-quinone oxidoreductase subunit C